MTHEQLEKKVMEMSLIPRHDPQNHLFVQYLSSTVVSREFTGVGFTTRYTISDNLTFEDVSKEICEVSAIFQDSEVILSFVVFITDGKLDVLEGYTSHGEWRKDYENIKLVCATTTT